MMAASMREFGALLSVAIMGRLTVAAVFFLFKEEFVDVVQRA